MIPLRLYLKFCNIKSYRNVGLFIFNLLIGIKYIGRIIELMKGKNVFLIVAYKSSMIKIELTRYLLIFSLLLKLTAVGKSHANNVHTYVKRIPIV